MPCSSVISYSTNRPCPRQLRSLDLINHVCDPCRFSSHMLVFQIFVFLFQTVMFNILLSIFVWAAVLTCSLSSWWVSIFLSLPTCLFKQVQYLPLEMSRCVANAIQHFVGSYLWCFRAWSRCLVISQFNFVWSYLVVSYSWTPCSYTLSAWIGIEGPRLRPANSIGPRAEPGRRQYVSCDVSDVTLSKRIQSLLLSVNMKII